MHLDLNTLLESLPIMGYGLGGIFIVIIVLIIILVLLNKIFPGSKDDGKE